MTMTQITIYTADWCAYCHAVKEYLKNKNIAFTEKNIETDPANAEEAIAKSGQMGIPVIDIDNVIIIGFDRASIDATLQEKNITT
jgi:glutaredoxin 3